MRVRAAKNKPHEFVMDEVYRSHMARSTDGLARIQLLHPQKNWLTVRIIDGITGDPESTAQTVVAMTALLASLGFAVVLTRRRSIDPSVS